MTRFAPALTLTFILHSGCAVQPPDATNEAELGMQVPPSWEADPGGKSRARSAEAAPVDHDWIRRFGDRKLEKLVDEGLAHNYDLKAAEARIAIAQANAELAGADMRPRMDAFFDASRQNQVFVGFPFGDPADGPAAGAVSSSLSNRFGASLDLAWELDVWGRVRSGVSAALSEVQASDADYNGARLSLAAQIAKSWFALIEARQQLNLAEESLTNFQSTEQVIRDRFELGQAENSGTGAQLRLAMSDVATAKAIVEARHEQLEIVVRQLEVLLGRYPDGMTTSTATLPGPPGMPPAGIPSELLRRRPDIIAAERRFAASGALYREAVLAYFPRFSLTASAGTVSENLKDIVDSDFGVWSLAGGVAQPILAQGRLGGVKRLRVAQEREAIALLQKTVLQGFSEVETALAVDSYLAGRASALEEAVGLASEADQQSRADYRDGVGDILTVLRAQDRLLVLRSDLIAVGRLRLDNRINLHLALGGDFRAASPSPGNDQES